MPEITDLCMLARPQFEDWKRLMLENLALRHQLGVRMRSVNKRRMEDSDRIIAIRPRRVAYEIIAGPGQ